MADSDSKIPYGFCQCGCGQLANYPKQSCTKYGWVKGEPMKYLVGHYWRNRIRANHPSWRGGTTRHSCGYMQIFMPEHLRANQRGYVQEHILVLEKVLGRPILVTEIPHHIDGDRTNNQPGNLMLFATNAMHSAYHARLTAYEHCGHYEWKKCTYCKKYDAIENMKRSPNSFTYFHKGRICLKEM